LITMENTKIGFLINKEDRVLMDKICEARQETISDFIRRSVRKELVRVFPENYSPEVKTALGMRDVI